MSLRFAELVAMSAGLAATGSRLEKVERLRTLLSRLAPDEIEPAVAMLAGGLRQGRIGLSRGAVAAAAEEAPPAATGPEQTELSFDVSGAAGAALTVAEVDRAFARMAGITGRGSAWGRSRLLAGLFHRAASAERAFLKRLIAGELRQGAQEGVMEEAVAAAAGLPPAAVRRAAMVHGELAAVARAALTGGAAALAGFRVQIFRPLRAMLAQTAADLPTALARLGTAALEVKLDGARVQVHKSGSEVRVFSRRLNEVTAAVPELVERVAALPARELILDGEALALFPDGTPRPFQVTMRRFGRRLDVPAPRAELPLTPFFFDLLFMDGETLIDAPARERFAALAQAAPGMGVERIVTADPDEAGQFYARALEGGHEGLMAKALVAPYEAGRRGHAWLKVKPAHTLDLVVLAAEWGHGRRSGWLSNLHLGARDEARGGFAMLGKTFKGMTDALLEWQTRRLAALEVGREGIVVHLRPERVVEVAFDGVQESPHYPAGMALRFARLKRYREDKTAAEADTVETVRAIMGGKRRRSE